MLCYGLGDCAGTFWQAGLMPEGKRVKRNNKTASFIFFMDLPTYSPYGKRMELVLTSKSRLSKGRKFWQSICSQPPTLVGGW